MKKLSKILSVLLCLAMLIGVVTVMAGAEESTTPTYTKVEVTSASNITAGTYLIYGLGDSSKTDANGNYCGFMTTENSTSSRLMSTQLTITGGTVATNDSNCVWNLIDAGNGGFYIQNAGNSKYLYWNKSKGGNSIYQADDTATASVWSVVSNGSAWTLQNADERQLSVNQFGSSPNFYLGFASYATNSSCTRALEFYKLNGSSSEETTEGTTEEETTESTTETTAPALPEAGSTLTIAEAIDIAPNADANTKYYITGEITSITHTTYGNMYIKDETGSILIYGLYDEAGNRFDAMETKPAVGDTITVYTVLSTYNGTPQAKNATMTELVPGEVEVDLPEAGSTLTIEEALAIAPYADPNTKYYISGVVTDTYGNNWATYGNLYIEDETGTILIYGLYNEDGTDRYDAMDPQPIVGDTITVYTVLSTYNGTPQAKNAWLTELTLGDGHEGTEGTTDPSESEETTTPSESEETTAPSEESTSSDVSGDTGDKTPGDTLSVFVGLLAVSTVGLAIVTSKKKEF